MESLGPRAHQLEMLTGETLLMAMAPLLQLLIRELATEL